MPKSPATVIAQRPFAEAEGLLRSVGNTPLVRLRRLPYPRISTGVEIRLKLESFNPSGSVKARAALAMILDARRRGLLHPGVTLLDASSGNTGIAYAMIAASMGYRLCLCLPANASAERKTILRAHGAEVIETDPLEGSDGAIVEARRLAEAHPARYCYLDQYNNHWNWRAHYGSTGPELWKQTSGKITHLVASLGTSGTFVGTSRFLKEVHQDVQCVAVQPDSPFHGLEGLKHMESSLVPGIWDKDVADEGIAAPTEASLALVRDLARVEGLLVGSSTGAALWAGLAVAERLESGLVVVIAPDSGERYLSEQHLWAQQ
jgi:S-sulfo-L-cysteine synthase (O-acetyl-L-serine-dependent)